MFRPMFAGLSFAYWLTLHGLVTVVAILTYAIAAHLLQQRRTPTAAIAWVLFMLLMPYLALPAFLTFGSRKQARPRERPQVPPSGVEVPGSWAVQAAVALGQPLPAAYDTLHVHVDGADALAALWRVIGQARESIDLCTFIVGRDRVGLAQIELLVARARAGVRVRVMIDGLGSLMRARPDLRPLRSAGVQLTMFVPPLHSPLKGRTNLRDHRKMVIVDVALESRRLWSGGRNLASEYFEGDAQRAMWHDLSFDVGGDFVHQAAALFAHDWAFANGHTRPVEAAARGAPGGATATAQLIASGPDQVDDTVYSMLIMAAYRARRRISLITPYFVPDAALLNALCLAARRGVRVELLLPASSNHYLSDVARRRALRALAAAGARVWVTSHMLHAKLVVVDEALAMAGSANLDSRSLFLNYELMVAFHDQAAVERFSSWFEHEKVPAQRLMPVRAGLMADVGEGLVLWLGFQL